MTSPAPDPLSIPVAVAVGPQPLSRSSAPSARDLESGTVTRVETTWRAWLLASMSVGRPIWEMVALYPESVLPEIRARADVVLSGLQSGTDAAGRPVARPSGWIRRGADPTESAAVGYRLGMAAAHWTAVYMLGLGSTRHVSMLPSSDTRRGRGGEADLFGRHPRSRPPSWLVEAKGGVRVTTRSRDRGAYQLGGAARRGYAQPHVQLLSSASAAPLLHVVADLATPSGTARPVGAASPASWPLAAGRPDPVDLFARRALAAALLLAVPAREATTPQGAVVLAEIPGTGVSVGLLAELVEAVQAQLGALRQIALSRVPVRSLEAAVADIVRDARALDARGAAGGPGDGPPRPSVALAETDRVLYAVDGAGLAVRVDRAATSDGTDRPGNAP